MNRALVFGCAGLVLLAVVSWYLHRPQPRADNVQQTYYRMKVGLTYKDQPVDIEFVGGCGVRATFSRASGGSTVETMAMSAFVFGARMPEGHAVVIRTMPVSGGDAFDVCLGATTNFGPPRHYDQPSTARQYEVPRDWLPFITWYEHDDNFAHGIGYATQDAYENPRARFGFRSASIEHATKDEFEAFLRDGPPNLVPPHLADAMSHLDAPSMPQPMPEDIRLDPTKAWSFASSPFCHGVIRARLDEDQRAEVDIFWPKDHPRYWSAEGDWRSATYLRSKVLRPDQSARPLARYHGPGAAESAPTTTKIFPVAVGERLDNVAHSTVAGVEMQTYDREILTGNGKDWLGYQFCEARPEGDIVTAFSKTASARKNYACRLGDLVVPVDGSSCDSGRWMAFENDEYAIIPLKLFQD